MNLLLLFAFTDWPFMPQRAHSFTTFPAAGKHSSVFHGYLFVCVCSCKIVLLPRNTIPLHSPHSGFSRPRFRLQQDSRNLLPLALLSATSRDPCCAPALPGVSLSRARVPPKPRTRLCPQPGWGRFSRAASFLTARL